MSKLEAFLRPMQEEYTEDRVISTRFTDEDGNPVPFTIRSITQQRNQEIIKQCQHPPIKGKSEADLLNKTKYQNMLIVECVVMPDFKDERICANYGVVNPIDVPAKMLLAGEYSQLTMAIMDICGFRTPEELADDAKN